VGGPPLMLRRMRGGLVSCSSGGRANWGMPWYETGRVKRKMAWVPTEVERPSEVAGQGPPWTMAWPTSTPVGKPLMTRRPTLEVVRSLEKVGFCAAVDEERGGAEDLFGELGLGEEVIGGGFEERGLRGEAGGDGSAGGGGEGAAFGDAVPVGVGDAGGEQREGWGGGGAFAKGGEEGVVGCSEDKAGLGAELAAAKGEGGAQVGGDLCALSGEGFGQEEDGVGAAHFGVDGDGVGTLGCEFEEGGAAAK
jgi:hypothetical protein